MVRQLFSIKKLLDSNYHALSDENKEELTLPYLGRRCPVLTFHPWRGWKSFTQPCDWWITFYLATKHYCSYKFTWSIFWIISLIAPVKAFTSEARYATYIESTHSPFFRIPFFRIPFLMWKNHSNNFFLRIIAL